MLMKSKLIYLLLFSLVICNSCKVNNNDQPMIFAAASLHDVLLDLSLEYEKNFKEKSDLILEVLTAWRHK